MDSNQVFVIFPRDLVRDLEMRFDFFVWEDNIGDGNEVVRLVTSWATEIDEVEILCDFVARWAVNWLY